MGIPDLDEVADIVIVVCRAGLIGFHGVYFFIGHEMAILLVGIAAVWTLEEAAGLIEKRRAIKKQLAKLGVKLHRGRVVPDEE